MPHDPGLFSILRLTMTPGLGPVLIRRAIEEFGSPEAALAANESGLKRIKGIGVEKARTIAAGMRESERAAEDELREAERAGAMLLAFNSNDYPPLLRQIPDPPPILYVRGRIAPGRSGPLPRRHRRLALVRITASSRRAFRAGALARQGSR